MYKENVDKKKVPKILNYNQIIFIIFSFMLMALLISIHK